MSAIIDGVQWNSILPVGALYVPASKFLTVSGSDTAGTPTASTKTIGLGAFISGIGTFNTSDPSFGAFQLMVGSQVWQAGGGQGGSGIITITVFSAHSASGTFFFTANPTAGSASGTKIVANGRFDVTF